MEYITIDNLYSVRHTYKREQGQVLPGHFTGFLEFDYNSSLESEAQSAPYPDGWVVSMHVFTVTPNIYQYYMSIGQQLNVNNSIFAPVPSQIKGNIKCVSDEYGKVIGAFEASTEIVYHKGFSWVNEHKYRSVMIDSFPQNIDMGSVRNIPPSFWVSF
jgi:hypothetical protein